MMNQRNKHESEYIDLGAMLKEFKKYWYLFLFFTVVAFGFAYIYNKFAPSVYKVTSTLMVSSGENRNGAGNRGELIEGLNMTAPNKELQNEIMVLQSQPLVEEVVRSMGLNTSYFSKVDYLPYRYPGFRHLRKYFLREIYKNSPFEVILDNAHLQPVNVDFDIAILNNEEYSLKLDEKDVTVYDYATEQVAFNDEDHINLSISHRFKFGEEVKGTYYSFKVFLSSNYNNEYKEKDLYFSFNNLHGLTSKFKYGLDILPVDAKATVVSISFEGKNVGKSMDFVNGLTNAYLQKDLAKKNFLAESTIEYIDQQILKISESLSKSEEKLQSFRKKNQVMDIGAKSAGVDQQIRELESQRNESRQKLSFYEQLFKHFEDNKDSPNLLAPSTMGVDDPGLNNMIQQLAALNSEKNTMIDRNLQKNSRFRTISLQIQNLKSSISQNIKFFISSTNASLNEINGQIAIYSYEKSKLPQTQQKLLEITRKFNLNDEIYTFLLKKRAEAQILKASNLPDSEVVEPAQFSGQTSPRKKRNYLFAIFIGIFIPAVFIQIKKLLNNKISDRKEIERITELPIVGKIIHSQDSNKFVLSTDPTNPVSDAYRILRTNLEFYLNGLSKSVILVTSTMGNDGKSFTSLNLASSFAFNEKKTILLGFDLRKPSELFKEFAIDNNPGISSYLIGKAKLDDIIIKTPVNHLDLIPAGPIPPNSLELISGLKTGELFSKLKKEYDYIIIDTSPVGILPDAFAMMKYSEINLLVVRHNFTIKEYFIEAINDLEKKKVENLFLVYNDVTLLKNELKYKHYYQISK